MAGIKFFIELLRLLELNEKSLDLTGMTTVDHSVISYLIDVSEVKTDPFSANYDDFTNAYGEVCSHTQFYKSLNKLIHAGYLKRAGGVRSRTYQWVF
ncbi:hypothetical protein [Marinobacterium sp. xm-d-564]|uniref:hypothetical protein n=1 Tax=Marinobacterium sp. xm-d-564 TaxID=2497742 RepID=UPI00156A3DFC|nr:hypothetical protein [Marinobacterium sp. xm-d-564]NRP59910.1 hypothetical protein [Marinobacterium sp. xm-d-564]